MIHEEQGELLAKDLGKMLYSWKSPSLQSVGGSGNGGCGSGSGSSVSSGSGINT